MISVMELEDVNGGYGTVSVGDGHDGTINAGNGYVHHVDSSGTTTYLGYEGRTIVSR